MYERTDLRSQSLDLLRFPLAVVVVIVHVSSINEFAVQGHNVVTDVFPLIVAVNHFVEGFFKNQSVPIYYFISGFVFFIGVDALTRQKYWQKMKNRVKSLLIPYLIWNVIAIILLMIKVLPLFNNYSPSARTFSFSWSGLLSCFWCYDGTLVPDPAFTASTYPVNIPLWFVRDLMVVVLFTPLINIVIKHTKHYALIVLGIVWFFLGYRWLGHINQLLTAFFFFSWGAYMSIMRKDIFVEFGRHFRLSVILYPLLSIAYIISEYCFPECSSTIKRLNVIVGLLFAYNIASWLLRRNVCKVNSFLSSSSFFVYVSHALICKKIMMALFVAFLPTSAIGFLCLYLCTLVLTLLSLLLVFYLMRRYCPSLLKVLTGRK